MLWIKLKSHRSGQHKGIHPNNTGKLNEAAIQLSSSPIDLVNTQEYILIRQVESGCYGLSSSPINMVNTQEYIIIIQFDHACYTLISQHTGRHHNNTLP